MRKWEGGREGGREELTFVKNLNSASCIAQHQANIHKKGLSPPPPIFHTSVYMYMQLIRHCMLLCETYN